MDANQLINDKVAADNVREAIQVLHEKVVAARQRGLEIALSLSAIGDNGFDPRSASVVKITRETIL
jgi:hypothetical protein